MQNQEKEPIGVPIQHATKDPDEAKEAIRQSDLQNQRQRDYDLAHPKPAKSEAKR